MWFRARTHVANTSFRYEGESLYIYIDISAGGRDACGGTRGTLRDLVVARDSLRAGCAGRKVERERERQREREREREREGEEVTFDKCGLLRGLSDFP